MKKFEVGQQVTYQDTYKGAKPEHGVVSSVENKKDGTQKVWVRYGHSSKGQLTPTDKLR